MDDNTIHIEKPVKSVETRHQMAMECAYATLVEEATRQDIPVRPCMGLMYLPSSEATRLFQEGCAAVLLSLAPRDIGNVDPDYVRSLGYMERERQRLRDEKEG